MLSRLILLAIGVGVAVQGAAVEQSQERDGKLFPVVQLVTFDNNACEASNGQHGTCFSSSECTANGGTASGTCAKGFGVCCIITATCETNDISVNNTYWTNTGSSSSMCSVSLDLPAGVCQVLLHLEAFDILGPVEGDCGNDTFTVNGATRTVPTLCGNNEGQHLYVDVDEGSSPSLNFAFSSISYSRNFRIKVVFIERDNPCKAPPFCLQYHKEDSGMIKSFNFGQMLNNLNYAICFHVGSDKCDVAFAFTTFDLGALNQNCGIDYVGAGGQNLCGDLQATTFQANCTAGPPILYVSSDSVNELNEVGFQGTYSLF